MTQKKFKVLSLATTYPESSTSKIPKFVHLLNRELVKIGVEITAIVPHSKDSKTRQIMEGVLIKRFRYLPENLELNSQSIAEAVQQSKFGIVKILLITFGLFFSAVSECIRKKPDFIHGHWAFPGGYIASLVSKIFGTKYIISIHGGEIPLLKKYKFILKPVIKSLNKSSHVIVNSNYSKYEFEKMGVKRDKIVQIYPTPNFVKHTADPKHLQEFRKQIVKNDSKIILFCGRLTERKGVEYLIRAIPDLINKNIHLVIAGGGGQESNLKQLTSYLQLNDRVTFFGRANDDELGLLHDISDIFVCPSIIDSHGETEGLGLVIPEAMESKLPVIGTSVGGIPDIIKNEINGLLVNEKDPKAIANAIMRILSDNTLRENIIKNSQTTIQEFLPETTAKKYYEIFYNLSK